MTSETRGATFVPLYTEERNRRPVKALRKKFGMTGYMLWCMILEALGGAQGFTLPCDALGLELLSADFGVKPERLALFIDYAVYIGALQRDEAGVRLWCDDLNERMRLYSSAPPPPTPPDNSGGVGLHAKSSPEEAKDKPQGSSQAREAKESPSVEAVAKWEGVASREPALFDGEPTAEVATTETKAKPKRAKAEPFVPPTLEEVKEEIATKGYNIDPEAFWYHYETNGWRQSKGNPIKNWQACLVTWSKRKQEQESHQSYQPRDRPYGGGYKYLEDPTMYRKEEYFEPIYDYNSNLT